MSLKVGAHEFRGEGLTKQQARHNAASKAIRVLKSQMVPVSSKQKVETIVAICKESGDTEATQPTQSAGKEP